MRSIYKNIAAATLVLAALFTGCARAQRATGNTLLWEVSGRGLEKPSYLYGTIHMICEADFTMADKVKRAFDTAEQLVIEANILDPNLPAIAQKVMKADVPLSKKLSKQDYAMIDSVLKLKCGVPLQPFENYKLVATLSLLAQKSFPCETTKSYEQEFIAMAQKKKMNIDALEGLEEEMNFLDKSYTDDQIISQVKTFDDNKAAMQQLVNLYKQQDLNGLYKNITATEFMDANTIHWLLEVRNNNWAAKMPEMMKKQSCFIAVGSAHLPGAAGIIKLLRDKGYTVKPIMN